MRVSCSLTNGAVVFLSSFTGWPCLESLWLCNLKKHHRCTAACIIFGNAYLVCAHECRALIGQTERSSHAHEPLITFSSSPASFSSLSPPHSQAEKTLLERRAFFAQTYGKNSRLSFLYHCAHYSLKIPPKKRRRFSKTFWPLSHVSTAKYFD